MRPFSSCLAETTFAACQTGSPGFWVVDGCGCAAFAKEMGRCFGWGQGAACPLLAHCLDAISKSDPTVFQHIWPSKQNQLFRQSSFCVPDTAMARDGLDDYDFFFLWFVLTRDIFFSFCNNLLFMSLWR